MRGHLRQTEEGSDVYLTADTDGPRVTSTQRWSPDSADF
jgi:hypothetical protein